LQEKFAYAGKTWRWFGPSDTVTLSDLKQMGVKGVVTSLHHLKPGEVWDTWAFGEISQLIENKGLRWSAVESLPVSEAIKKGDEFAEIHIQNYIESLHNLAANGVDRVCYNFMPVIDWVRTDLSYCDADGSETMLYDSITFALFDLFIL
jgi:mannonate dehydratase